MSVQRNRLLIAGGFSVGLVISVLILFLVVAKIALPDPDVKRIVAFTVPGAVQMQVLPFGKLARSGHESVSGTLRLPMTQSAYAYIPKYEGELTITYLGNVLFYGTSPSSPGRSGSALFKIPDRALDSQDEFKFTLAQSSKRYILMSNIYIGDRIDFSGRNDFVNRFVELGSVLLMGLNIAIVFGLFAMVSTRYFGLGSAPAFVMSIYILVLGVSTFGAGFSNQNVLAESIFLMFPILIGNLWLNLGIDHWALTRRKFVFVQIIAVTFGLVFIGLNYTLPGVDVFLLAVVLAALALLGIGILQLWTGLLKADVFAVITAGGLLICCAAIGHDAAIRIGFFQNDIYIAAFGKIVFILLAASSFGRLANKLSGALIAASRGNGAENSATQGDTVFAEQRAIFLEKKRIQEELHDGVLSHLSVINALTEDAKDGDRALINRLCRSASSEIRLLLENEIQDKISLMSALENFRRHYLDRLAETGIAIDIKTAGLQDLDRIDFKIAADVIRILQEAVHNATMRGRCTTLTIRAEAILVTGNLDQSGFRVRVENWGGSTFLPDSPSGQGIPNMRLRAHRIAADFQLEARPGGAVLILTWPGTDTAASGAIPLEMAAY